MIRNCWMSMGLVFASIFGGLNANDAPPSVVLILADDLGWSDLPAYGHLWHRTPHLDALAASGIRFTSAYSAAPICSASRAGLLTGRTPAALQFEFVTKNEPGRQQIDFPVSLQTPPYTLNLPLRERTIAEALAERGYQTAFFGKWHLNQHYQRYLGWHPMLGPQQQGFAVAHEDFGSHPYRWGRQTPQPIQQDGQFDQDTMVDRAVEFLKRGHEQPFFLMVSLFHVHTPVRSRLEWLKERFEQVIPGEAPARPKRVDYAAFVSELDHLVGRLLQTLNTTGQRENTLVLFTSDNGGHPEYTANSPLRGSKWNLYEGGIRVPMIAAWPAVIRAGGVCDTPVSALDLFPTFLEAAGDQVVVMDRRSGQSRSILPELTGGSSKQKQRELYWHFPYYHPERGYAEALSQVGIDDFAVSRTVPQSAIRSGHDKLLYFHDDQHTELYNLADDPGESKNLAASHPELNMRLRKRLLELLGADRARFPQPQAQQ